MNAQRRAAVLGLTAAALFGASAPLATLLVGSVRPQVLAGLLYLGAGLALTAWRRLRPVRHEAPLRRQDLPRVLGVAIAGGLVAPVAMMQGLAWTGALTGSLMLNLEAVFTIVLAVTVFKEHLGWRVAAAALGIVAGAAVLRLDPEGGPSSLGGVALLALACACWAVDNNLTQQLSLKDPFALVQVKTLWAGAVNLSLGLALAEGALPPPGAVSAALALGAVSYGLSVVLDAYALRVLGAAREAAYLATGPFVGAAVSVVVAQRLPSWPHVAAAAAMAGGVAVLIRERHGHRHEHEPLAHDHLHVHDDHHAHVHGPEDPPGEPHAHAHRHDRHVHDHPHAPDAHHRHRH